MNVCPPSLDINEWSQALRLKVANSLFTNSCEGICITDASEQIVDVNPTFCQLTGYSREELQGKTPRILNSGLQPHEFYADMWKSLQGTGEWHGELWNRNRSGALYAVRLNISAICDASGSVTHYLGIMADITAMKAHQDEWEQKANFDLLTGLPNRLLLADRLRQAMAHSRRTGLLLAICYLDLDGFKPINDGFGHEVGDHVLVETANRLSRSVRAGDTVARVGGDEFVLLLWGIENVQECDQTLDRLISDVDSPISFENREFSVTVSVGVAVFPIDGDDPSLLTAQADSAMYRSKRAGGNRCTYFEA